MKRLFPMIALLITLGACQKEKEEEKTPDYFNEPVINWALDKDEIKAREKRTLLGDYGPESVFFIDPMFQSKGSGYLDYDGDSDVLEKVTYGFFCNAETLNVITCDFVFNSQIASELKDYMVSKYGKIYSEYDSGLAVSYTWELEKTKIKLFVGKADLWINYYKNPL